MIHSRNPLILKGGDVAAPLSGFIQMARLRKSLIYKGGDIAAVSRPAVICFFPDGRNRSCVHRLGRQPLRQLPQTKQKARKSGPFAFGGY